MYNDKFGRDQARLTYLEDQRSIKEYLDQQALKNYFYYQNDQVGMLKFLNEYLHKMISKPEVKTLMPRVLMNEVPRVVRRLSMIYKKQPDREYSSLSEEQETVLKWTYKKYKEFHRQAKLLNTILVRPIWNEDGYFDYHIIGRQYADVVENINDFNKMDELSYWKVVKDNEGQDEFIKIHWTEENYWATDADGNPISPSLYDFLDDNNENPYKRIPFIKLKLQDSSDFWGDGLSDIVNMQEHNNAKLCDTYYKLWMSFGYPVGQNLQIKADEFSVSPYQPIMVDNIKGDDQPASLDFVTPDHKVEQDQDTVDWARKSAGNTKGMSGSSMSEQGNEMSGYRKMLDEQEIIEANEEDKEVLRDFEFELFDMMKLEAKTMRGMSFENVNMESVSYKPYEQIKTSDELWFDREQEYKYNLSTPVDWKKEESPNMTEEEILETLKKNRVVKVELGGDRPSLLERINE